MVGQDDPSVFSNLHDYLTSFSFSLCQMVVLCFAVVFGSFSQSYGPYPSATKMVLPRQHSSPESYTDSIGK